VKDGFVRRTVKRVALWRYNTDLWASRRIRQLRGDAPDLELHGSCTGCGACCDTPSIQLPTVIFFFKSVRAAVKLWHRHVNGFEYIGLDRRNRIMIFSCSHLDPVTKQCDSYDSRPGLCRDYPVNLLDDVRPTFFPKCGYFALDPDAESIRADLAELDLTPRRREYVERTFYVWTPPPGQSAWHLDEAEEAAMRASTAAVTGEGVLSLVPQSAGQAATPDSDRGPDQDSDPPTPRRPAA
jgi:Fe-S-cluster containining protein